MMLKLGSLELNGTPRVAVGFTDQADSALVSKAVAHGVDVAEVRIDRFASHDVEYVKSVLSLFAGLPTIGTIRIKAEGGDWTASEEARLELFRAVIPHVDAIDIELRSSEIVSAVEAETKAANKLLIVSYHDFSATPDIYTLDRICEDASKAGADLIKISTQITESQDIAELSSFCMNHPDKHLIVIGMGGRGLVTRLFFPALGSLLTFAYFDTPTAPGQLDYPQMFDLMRLLYPDFNEEKIASLSLTEDV